MKFASEGIYNEYVKKAFDFVLSFVGLIVLSPLLLVVYCLVKKNLGSPAIFVQERPGLNERIFKLYKFRTMTDKKDSEGNLLPDGERLTKLGKFLRCTSIDELPELYNIFKGEMSIVGPRPLLVQYLPLYTKEQRHRHAVKPGLTGLAQVSGRNAISWEERFNLDLKYIDNINIFTDIHIVLLTIRRVLFRDGISSDNEATMECFTGTTHKRLQL